ncbi:DUF6049 family protein [Nocardioides sp. LML1-1-1.1]|uniref:DUF6049 family protein n=1 Tax=Nocardioides sp. LML1-1-1.1 TaxID=3135248 RepID=UPI0034140966
MVGRPALLRALAGVVTGLALATSVAAPPASAEPRPAAAPDDQYDAPLAITIDALKPGVLPRTGPLVISGEVTNTDLETWTGVRLYPVFNAGPDCAQNACPPAMTTAAALADAASSDPMSLVGTRDTNVRFEVDRLEPGQSATYTLTIPQSELRARFGDPETGVYWLGVHALGTSPTSGNDGNAVGRARTFLPYVRSPRATSVKTAVVLPLRARIAHEEDGTLDQSSTWEQALRFDGELGGPLSFGAAAAGIAPVTWLLDPAVPDAVRQLALGNPKRAVRPKVPPGEDPSPSDGASPTPEGDDADAPDPDTPLAASARTWLSRAESQLRSGTVAALPYGDPDVAAAADTLPSLYRAARQLTGTEVSTWDLDTLPVVAPPNGYLDLPGIDAVDDDASLLLGEQMFPREDFTARPPVGGLVDDRPVVVTSTAAATGGPGPDAALAPVALRQRILSEAVVRLLRAGGKQPDPLTVVLPDSITGTGAQAFWRELDVPWLDLVGLGELIVPAGSPADGEPAAERQVDTAKLSYPPAQEKAELSSGVLIEAGQLIRAGRSLQSILGEDYTVGTELVAEALAGTSYALRDDADAGARLTRTKDWTESQLGAITIDAPSGVTLSGTSGSFNIALRNELDQPVTVDVAATTDSGARIRVTNPVRLAANSRTSVPVSAEMTRSGVHNVTLRVVDADGTALGAADTLPLRTGQVGVVIWVIIGSGVGILFVAIAIRLVRRFRRRGADAAGEAG